MFSLIIAVVAIALVVATIAATMYFGGDTFSEGKKEAEVAQAVNELGQIHGAVMAFNATEGEPPETMQDLIPGYLKTAPAGWGMDTPNVLVFEAKNFKYGSIEENRNACQDVNIRMGHGIAGEAPPACDSLPTNFYGCCEVIAASDGDNS